MISQHGGNIACGRGLRKGSRSKGLPPSAIIHQPSAIVSHRESEVIGPQDAAVTEFAGLAAGGESDEAGAGGDIDRESDTFLTTDHVAVGGSDIPDAPGYALENLLDVRWLMVDG